MFSCPRTMGCPRTRRDSVGHAAAVRLTAGARLCHAQPTGREWWGAMAHNTQAAHGHMHDHEGHVQAVEADLEYWRTKRLEPRVLQLHRRGMLTLYDLSGAAADVPAAPALEAAHDTEDRIRSLEVGLDDYIRGIGLVSVDAPDHPFVIEDTRKERGDYDDFFRIAKPPHGGTLVDRIARLEQDL